MKKLLIILTILLAISSCKTKKVINQSHEVSTVQKDTIYVTKTVEKSLAIHDTILIQVPVLVTGSANCDSVCNLRFKDFLKNVNTKKTSGNNSAGAYYDKYNNLLVLYNNQKETINSQKDSITKNYIDKNDKQIVEIPVDKPFTKEQTFNLWSGRIFWVLLLVYIIYRIIKVYNNFTNPLKL